MSRLKVQLELNPGGDGIRLDKLAGLASELEKFLRNLANDCGVSVEPGDWVARQFYNSSVGALIEYVGTVDPVITSKFNIGIKRFATFDIEKDSFAGEYSEATIRQFVEIGTKLDTDEVVRLGVISPSVAVGDAAGPVEWQNIAKRTTLDVEEATLRPIFYIGSIQGRLGTWFKESDFIYVRDIVTGTSVKCTYKSGMYDQIYKCYKDRQAVIHISGRIKSDRLSGHPKEMAVTQIQRFDKLSDEEFVGLFGSAPSLTGEEAISDFLDRMRDDGDA